jgi:hypothetical protein
VEKTQVHYHNLVHVTTVMCFMAKGNKMLLFTWYNTFSELHSLWNCVKAIGKA